MAKDEEKRRYVEDELREEGPLEAVKDDAKKAKDAVSPGSAEESESPEPRRESESPESRRAPRAGEAGADEDEHTHLEDELRDEGPMEAIKNDAKRAKDAVTSDSEKKRS